MEVTRYGKYYPSITFASYAESVLRNKSTCLLEDAASLRSGDSSLIIFPKKKKGMKTLYIGGSPVRHIATLGGYEMHPYCDSVRHYDSKKRSRRRRIVTVGGNVIISRPVERMRHYLLPSGARTPFVSRQRLMLSTVPSGARY